MRERMHFSGWAAHRLLALRLLGLRLLGLLRNVRERPQHRYPDMLYATLTWLP